MDLSWSSGSSVSQLPSTVIHPIGDGNDWARFVALAKSLAGNGAAVLGPGLWTVNTVGDFSGYNDVSIRCMPGARIVSALTPTGGPGGFAQCPFYSTGNYAGSAMSVVGTPAQGATSFTMTSIDGACVPSAYLAVSGASANVASLHKILTVVGNVVTVQEVSEHSWASPVVAQAYVPVQRFNLDLTGSTITGTGDRYVEFGGHISSRVRGMRAIRDGGTPDAFIGSFDIAGRNNTWEDCEADGAGHTNAGLAAESNDGARFLNCKLFYIGTGAGSAPIYLPSCIEATIDTVSFAKCWNGILMGPSDVGDTTGNQRIKIDNISATDQAGGQCILCGDGDAIEIGKVSVIRGTGSGIYLSGSIAAGPTNVTIESLTCENLAGVAATGLYASVATVQVGELSVTNVAYPVTAAGSRVGSTVIPCIVEISKLRAVNCKAGSVALQDATLIITHGDWIADFAGAWPSGVGDNVHPYTLKIRSGTLYMAQDAGHNKTFLDGQQGITLEMSNFKATSDGIAATTYGVYLQHAGALHNHVYSGPNVDMSVFANPLLTSGGDTVNILTP